MDPTECKDCSYVTRMLKLCSGLLKQEIATVCVYVCVCVSSQGYENPDKFDPDRFGPERQEDIKYAGNFLVFGHGPHYCVGKEYAQNHLAVFLARIASSVDIERVRSKVREMGACSHTHTHTHTGSPLRLQRQRVRIGLVPSRIRHRCLCVYRAVAPLYLARIAFSFFCGSPLVSTCLLY